MCEGCEGEEGEEGGDGVEYEEYEHVVDGEMEMGMGVVVASMMSCGSWSRAWARSWRLCLVGNCAKYGFVYMVRVCCMD